MRTKLALVAVGIVTLLPLTGCSEPPPPRESLNSGEIVQIVKHDEVEVKDKICTLKKTERYRQNGRWKTREVCTKHKVVTREISPEWYEFELQSGNKKGWTGPLDEETGEAYQKGDKYP
jgi:hypothetical protein